MNPEEIIRVTEELAPSAAKAAEETAAKLLQCADLSGPRMDEAAVNALSGRPIEPISLGRSFPPPAVMNEWLAMVLGPQKLGKALQAEGETIWGNAEQNLKLGSYNEDFFEPGRNHWSRIARKQLDILILSSQSPTVRVSDIEVKTLYPKPTIEWGSDHSMVVIRVPPKV